MTDNSNITLRLALDQQALQQSQAGVRSLSSELLAAKAAAQSAGQTADASLRDIASGAGDGTQSVNELKSALDAAGSSAQNLSNSGSGGFGLQGLRRTGSALNQLGLGSIGQPVQLLGDIGQVTKELGLVSEALAAVGGSATTLVAVAAPVALAIGGVVLAFEALQKTFADGKAGIEAATRQLEGYYNDIQTKTTAQIKKDLADTESQINAKNRTKNDLETQRDNVIKTTLDQYQKAFDAGAISLEQLQTAKETVPVAAPGVGDLQDQIDQLNKDLGPLVEHAAVLHNELSSLDVVSKGVGETVANKLVKAFTGAGDEFNLIIKNMLEAQKKAEADAIQSAEDNSKTQLAINKEIASDTYAQARARLDAISQEQAANLQLIQNLKAIPDPTGEAAAKIAKLTEANKNLVNEGTQLLANLDNLPTEIADRNKRIEAVQEQFNADTLAADQKLAQDRANIQQKLNDTLAADAQKLADTLAQDLTNLQNKQADNLTNLNRDETAEQVDQSNKTLTIQIDTQRKAVQLAQDHAAALAQIQQDAYAREFGLLLNRNFGGLLADRLQQTADMNKENGSFNSKSNQLKTDENNQLDDLARSIAEQRQARIVAYNNANADAQTQYNRETKAANDARELADQRAQQARVDALNILNKQFADEYNARYANYVQQLILQNKFGQDYLTAQNNIQNKLLQQANNALAALNNASEMAHPGSYAVPSNAAHRAGGGPLAAGQPSWVNEKFNGTPFPPGLGLFIPARGGNVSGGAGGSGGAGMTNNWYIKANDVAGVRNEILNIMEGIQQ